MDITEFGMNLTAIWNKEVFSQKHGYKYNELQENQVKNSIKKKSYIIKSCVP